MTDAIRIERLTKRFGQRMAVNDLSLDVPEGAVFALLGENGAGKSTTLRMLVGQMKPDWGQATILGLRCWHDAAKLRERVGYMPERPKFYDWMRVEELGWFCAGFHAAGFLERFRDRIARYEIDSAARLQTLSKGTYAKVALALALAVDPQVLVLDEPTSGLDLLVRREVLSSMVDLAAEGRTVLIASHQISEVERVASHVALLSEGRLVHTATLDDLRRQIVAVRLRCLEMRPDPARLGQVLEVNGSGDQWYAVLREPDRGALSELRASESIVDYQELPLNLEEIYTALLSREARPGARR